MPSHLSRYDYALLAIPGALLLGVLVAITSSVSTALALSAGSVIGAGIIYEVLVRKPPSR